MVKAVNEIGYKPKMIGGAMVGLQATVFKNQLGPLLNGFVNYETWVPAKSMMFAGTDEFFKKYQARAGAEGVDPLGYYLGGWGYAYVQVLGEAIKGDQQHQRRQVRRVHEGEYLQDHHGDIKFGANGEWAKIGMLQVQYHGIKQDAGLDALRGMELPDRADARSVQDRRGDLSLREGEAVSFARHTLRKRRAAMRVRYVF